MTKALLGLIRIMMILITLAPLINPKRTLATTTSQPRPASKKAVTMVASFYGQGDRFHGRRTASGTIFNKHRLTAAHRSLPFGTKVVLVNPKNGRQVKVTITDRGPYIKGRDIDLSWKAAKVLGMVEKGVVKLRARVFPPYSRRSKFA